MRKYRNRIFTALFVVFTIGVIIWSVSDEKPDNIAKKEIKEVLKEDKVEDTDTKQEIKVIVDVKGEVVNPGVYELTNKNNVIDAITLAGGLTSYSDTSNINLSKKLSDEMVIVVYSFEEVRQMKASKEVVCPKVNDACLSKDDEKSILDDNIDDYKDDEFININSATKEQLLTLDGIGEAKAQAIIEYRNKNGAFETIEDIKNVSGIGEAAFEKIKDSITV